MLKGHCHCGTVRYEISGEPVYSALCHCGDCRRSAGAPVVGWTAFPEASFKILQGKPKVYRSSDHGRRYFCPDCGSGLYYCNSVNLPGIVDIQTATLDDPTAIAPKIHVQAAERISWMENAHELPVFERYPSRG